MKVFRSVFRIKGSGASIEFMYEEMNCAHTRDV